VTVKQFLLVSFKHSDQIQQQFLVTSARV